MSVKTRKEKMAAQIARANGWQPGMVLIASEEGRNDVRFRVTAVGDETVLGRRMLSYEMLASEIALPLTDEFIRWSRE
jgi:hypothetical protein